MRCRRCLRGPVEQVPLVIIAKTRRMIERCVISRRHRPATNGLLDALQRGGFPLRIVLFPVGEVERAPGRVTGQVGGRNSRIPGRGPFGGMATVTRLYKNCVYSGVSAERVRRIGHWCGGDRYVFSRTRTTECENAEKRRDQNSPYRDYKSHDLILIRRHETLR